MKPLTVIAIGSVVVLITTIGVVGIALLIGAFDFSATAAPSALEERVARFVLNRSIERRAPKSSNPLPLTPTVIAEGLSHYRTNCLVCHGAPGVEPFELGKGLNPRAPDLSASAVQGRSDGELFWIVRHGIKMTGMPAFGPTHSDEEIWAVVGTVRRLPQITAADRASLASAHEAQAHRHDGETSATADPQGHEHEAPDTTVDQTQKHRHDDESLPATSEHHGRAREKSPAATTTEDAGGEGALDAHKHPGESTPAPAVTEHETHEPKTTTAAPHHPPDSTESNHGQSAHPPAGHEQGAAGHEQPAHESAGTAQGHGEHGVDSMGTMTGLYGPYPMSREASGTAWQPDLASHKGAHVMRENWMLLFHGFATGVYDNQGGMRGDEDFYSASMLMGMARRPLGSGTLGLRAMLSADPATIGKEGYPLLLQTGETADGREPLIDRQHPHDLFMELAASFSVASADKSAFLYLGMPGEPAFGPPAFMHRYSGVAASLAPISHHWLDSTHITYGVATVGLVKGPAKLEGSVFTGREPDEKRAGWDSPKMDSYAFRASFNPRPEWSLQVSFGQLESPEQLHPEEDTDRTTASIMYNHPRTSGETQVTLAWGRNRNRPGQTTDMVLAEAAASLGARSILFARAERGKKNELFDEDDPRADEIFTVSQLSAGYLYDVLTTSHLALGIGGSAGVSFVPQDLESVYGEQPFSGTIFARALLK